MDKCLTKKYSTLSLTLLIVCSLSVVEASPMCIDDNLEREDRKGKARCIEKDEAAVIQLYRQAAAQGNSFALYKLGKAYSQGKGIEKDEAAAIKLYGQAAEKGNYLALYKLGNAYSKGKGTVENQTLAIQLYRHTAERAKGLTQLQREGIEKDVAAVIQLYRQAAKHGDSIAQYELINIYFTHYKYRDHKSALWYSLLAKTMEPSLIQSENLPTDKLFNEIKRLYKPALIAPSENSAVKFIYNLENSPLNLFGNLAKDLAELNSAVEASTAQQQTIVSSKLPLTQFQNVSQLYKNFNYFKMMLTETLPNALSKPGFLITNLTFSPELNKFTSLDLNYIKIKGQVYVYLGEENGHAVKNIFVTGASVIKQTASIANSMIFELSAGLQALNALVEESDNINELKNYHQRTVNTLISLVMFSLRSGRFIEETVIASTSERNKIFADKFGALLK